MAAQAREPQPLAPLTSSPYPFAAAPDIIRAHQKDAYFQGVLTNQLTDLHRRLRGARAAHAWATESTTAADLLYLCLTTLLGNRTLGEEYCDLVQVEEPTPLSRQAPGAAQDADPIAFDCRGGPRLPSLARRAGYIATSILLPYLAGRVLPSLRAAARARLQDRLAVLLSRERQQEKKMSDPGASSSLEYRLGRYVLTHLSTLTSGAHVRVLALAAFYFGGAYYSLPKRLFGLRYVFTRRPPQNSAGGDGRGGYEVLGALLIVQMTVRAYLHVKTQLDGAAPVTDEEVAIESAIRERALASGGGAGLSLGANAYSSNNALLVDDRAGAEHKRKWTDIGALTHTPLARGGRPRYDLRAGDGVMGWIKGRQQRQCTLCLEGMRDPAATQCGHLFCWTCIGDWVREKPECPLCRRQAMVQHILPLRVA